MRRRGAEAPAPGALLAVWMAGMIGAQPAGEPTTVARGHLSGISDSREVVIEDDAGWATLWAEHAEPPRPVVDFGVSVVVGVTLGRRPSAGYSVEIVRVRAVAGERLVEYAVRRPPPGVMTPQVVTAPFHFVRLPRDGGAIRFARLAP